jgi:hypothetical protein
VRQKLTTRTLRPCQRPLCPHEQTLLPPFALSDGRNAMRSLFNSRCCAKPVRLNIGWAGLGPHVCLANEGVVVSQGVLAAPEFSRTTGADLIGCSNFAHAIRAHAFVSKRAIGLPSCLRYPWLRSDRAPKAASGSVESGRRCRRLRL